MPSRRYPLPPGPFRVAHLRSGDRYELSKGNAIYCAPSGVRHGGKNLLGGTVLGTDPAVTYAGVDTGFAPDEATMRAPDVSVATLSDEQTGFAQGAPPLAVEYADKQDEAELSAKIGELLAAGTQQVWVVRLRVPRRVEVHAPGQAVRVCSAGELLEAPGVLQNAVPVEALFEREAAFEVTLRNLLQRKGYESVEHVLARGREEGREEGRLTEARAAVRNVLTARGLTLAASDESRLEACDDHATLVRWLVAAATVTDAAHVLR